MNTKTQSYLCARIRERVMIKRFYENCSGIGDDHAEPVLCRALCSKEIECPHLDDCPIRIYGLE